jgi:hypothetical protein
MRFGTRLLFITEILPTDAAEGLVTHRQLVADGIAKGAMG